MWFKDTTGMGFRNLECEEFIKDKKVVLVNKSDWDWKSVTDTAPVSLFSVARKPFVGYCMSQGLPSIYSFSDTASLQRLTGTFVKDIAKDTIPLGSKGTFDVLNQATLEVVNRVTGNSKFRGLSYLDLPKTAEYMRQFPEDLYKFYSFYGTLPYSAYTDLASLYISSHSKEELQLEGNLVFVGTDKASVSQWMFIQQYMSKSDGCDVFLSPAEEGLFSFLDIDTRLKSYFQDEITSTSVQGIEVVPNHAVERRVSAFDYYSMIEGAKERGDKYCLLVNSNRALKRVRSLPDGTKVHSKLDLEYTEQPYWSIIESYLMHYYSGFSLEANVRLRSLVSSKVYDKLVGPYPSIKILHDLYQGEEELCILDTETTGLDYSRDVIVEFAAVKVKGGEVVEEIDIFRKSAHLTLTKEISNLTGITKELLLKEGLEDEEFKKSIRSFLDTKYVMAYNSPFDIAFIAEDVRIFPEINLDLLDAVKCLYPNLISYKLGDVGESLQAEGANTHRAIDDVLLSVEVYKKCAEKYHEVTHVIPGYLSEEGQMFGSAINEELQTNPTLTGTHGCRKMIFDSIMNDNKWTARKLLLQVGVPEGLLDTFWDDTLSVSTNLRRFILEPNIFIEESVNVRTVYELGNSFYDAFFVETPLTKVYDFVRARAKVLYISDGYMQ